MPIAKRLVALAAFFAVWGLLYAVAPLVGLTDAVFLAWDPARHVPVLTPFVLPYLSFYLMPAALFLSLAHQRDLWPVVKGLTLIVIVSTAVFILVPIVIVKPAVSAEWHLGGWLLTAVHAADTNANCFPSEHVSIATFCALALGRLRPNWRWLWWLWGTLVVLSTVFTRQHYVTDVIGGLVVAWLGWRYARLPTPTASS